MAEEAPNSVKWHKTLHSSSILQVKTAQSVIEHTAKYNDAYSTIDKFVDGFWERVPYLCIGLTVIIIFWLLSKLFKFFVRKTLENKSYTRQNLVLVLNRVGSTAIMFFGFLIAMVIAIPGFTPAQLMSALGLVRLQSVLHLKIFFKIYCLVFLFY